MIHANGVSKSFGGQVVLSNVSLTLTPGSHIGLVGRNGGGKTTLLRILCGQMAADSGTVTVGPGCRVGYLGQEGQLSPQRTLYEEMRDIFAHAFELEAQLRDLESAMADAQGGQLQECMNQYAHLQAQYDLAEGHLIDPRIRTVLAGLGFRPEDLDRPCQEFSGGWQMRGAMARLLLSAPTLLLLDEPTNHLDVAAVEWLEQYLAEYPGAVVLVSHDRYFLDRTTNHIVELEDGSLADYRGNYTFYLEEKERRREAQESAYQNQQKKLEHDQRFIDRFRYKATLATRVKSREKMLEKMERVEAPTRTAPRMAVGFVPAATSGRDAIVAKGLRKSYGSIRVLEQAEVRADRGDRIALVGSNGAGKSTLLRLLAGLEPADAGSVNPGFRLQPVYFAQHQAEALDSDRTVLEEMEAAAPDGTDQTRIRTILGCLLFSGDDVYKKVGVCSGGERSRLALSRCVVQPSNVLFLDEPTNHLDISARESLLQALGDYEGTIVFISHDRRFMDGLATKVIEIENGRTTQHLGNYSDYRARKLAQEKQRVEPAAPKSKPRPATVAAVKASSPPKRTNTKWKIDALESRIFALEEEIAKVGAEMALPETYQEPQRAVKLKATYDKLVAECEELTRTWDELTAAG